MAVAEVRVTNKIAGTELLAWTQFPCDGLAVHVETALRSQRKQAVTALFRNAATFGADAQVAAGERIELTAVLGEALPVFRCFCGHPTWDNSPGFCCLDHENEDRRRAVVWTPEGTWVKKCWCENATAWWPGGEGYKFCCRDHEQARPDHGAAMPAPWGEGFALCSDCRWPPFMCQCPPVLCFNPKCAETNGTAEAQPSWDGKQGSYCSRRCEKAHKEGQR